MASVEPPVPPVRVVVELVRGDEAVVLGAVTCPRRTDLDLVDDLLRMHLIVGRLGWRVRVRDLCEPLRDVLDLVGVADQLDVPDQPAGGGADGAERSTR